MSMQTIADGPNVRRVREAGTISDVRACVVTGPGDTELWEVTGVMTGAPIRIAVAGRGADLEDAAANLIATLGRHFPSSYRVSGDVTDEE